MMQEGVREGQGVLLLAAAAPTVHLAAQPQEEHRVASVCHPCLLRRYSACSL